MSIRRCDLIEVALSGGRVFLQPEEPVPDECVRARLDFGTRKVMLSRYELSFEDVYALVRTLEFYGGQ